MNYLLLYSVGRYCNYKSKWWRICLGSAFGTLYVFAIFFKDTNYLYSSIIKLIVSILMINIAFRIKTVKNFFKTIILFYIAAFILSGGILALFYLTNANFETINGSFIIKDIKAWHLIVGSIGANILIKIAFDFLDNYHKIQKGKIELKIIMENKSTSIKALIDTGNSLKDPETNKPIIVAYVDAINKILPEDIQDLLLSSKSKDFKITEKLESPNFNNRVKLIPYKTLGTENGTLLGICVDAIEVRTKKDITVIKNAVIALYDKPVSDLGDYEALAYSEILSGGN